MTKRHLEFCDNQCYEAVEYYCGNCGTELSSEDCVIHCGEVYCMDCAAKLFDLIFTDSDHLHLYENELND